MNLLNPHTSHSAPVLSCGTCLRSPCAVTQKHHSDCIVSESPRSHYLCPSRVSISLCVAEELTACGTLLTPAGESTQEHHSRDRQRDSIMCIWLRLPIRSYNLDISAMKTEIQAKAVPCKIWFLRLEVYAIAPILVHGFRGLTQES